MNKKIILFFVIFFSSLSSLEKQPWFGDVYEFHFMSKYTFFRFKDVEAAIIQPDSVSNNNLLYFDLSFSPTLQWSIDSDLEFIDTPRQEFSFRSVAFQARYLAKDDIIGDPVSITLGSNFRVVSTDSLKDVSTLYHANVDFEINLAFGKEFSNFDSWRLRAWGYGAVGIANRGSPWIRGRFSLEGNIHDERRWAFFIDAMKGYGKEEVVDVYNFHGYGKIRQSNVDVGFRYGYSLGVMGSLSFEYVRTLLARRCIKDVNYFSISYLLPFSF